MEKGEYETTRLTAGAGGRCRRPQRPRNDQERRNIHDYTTTPHHSALGRRHYTKPRDTQFHHDAHCTHNHDDADSHNDHLATPLPPQTTDETEHLTTPTPKHEEARATSEFHPDATTSNTLESHAAEHIHEKLHYYSPADAFGTHVDKHISEKLQKPPRVTKITLTHPTST